jgi:hypothetical protein
MTAVVLEQPSGRRALPSRSPAAAPERLRRGRRFVASYGSQDHSSTPAASRAIFLGVQSRKPLTGDLTQAVDTMRARQFVRSVSGTQERPPRACVAVGGLGLRVPNDTVSGGSWEPWQVLSRGEVEPAPKPGATEPGIGGWLRPGRSRSSPRSSPRRETRRHSVRARSRRTGRQGRPRSLPSGSIRTRQSPRCPSLRCGCPPSGQQIFDSYSFSP